MQTPGPVTYGIRGEEFRQFIFSILQKARIKEHYINFLLEDEAVSMYDKAFTSPTANSSYNYEMLEKIGDLTCNKAIIWYIYRKLPQLSTKPQGLMIFSKLFHTLQCKETFAKIALSLGFEKFVTYGFMRVKDRYENVMIIRRNSVLEDCFEAFFGATELIIDSKVGEGVGYAICNILFKALISDLKFPSLKYEDLFDSITRLKELFDYHFPNRRRLGKYDFIDEPMDEVSKIKTVKILWTNVAGQTAIIAQGSGPLKDKAKAAAAEHALLYFKSRGWEKPPPYDYRDFLSK